VTATPPSTYAAWVDLIHSFEAGEQDEAVIGVLQTARVVLSAGMGERLYRRIVDVFELRVRRISASLQKRLDRGTEPVAFGAAIVSARKELAVLARFAGAPCWPPDAGKMMRESLDDFARRTHDALEESARKRERLDRGAQLSLVRRTPLSVPWPQTSSPPEAAAGPVTTAPPSGARRIII
jgi:hypothetical protein